MIRYIKELIAYREVLLTLVVRDIKVRYKQTVVGVVWAILQPLIMMWIFSIIFDKFTNLPSEGAPYPIFCLTALVPWTFFTNAINLAIPSLVDNESLITKIYFPREILPLSSICAAMADFFVAVLIYFFILASARIHLGLVAFMVIPVFLIQLIFTLGVVMFASALNVFYRDVKFIVPFLIQIGMFATPIVYSTVMISDKYKPFYMLNPMAGVIDAYRKVILGGVMPNPQYLFNAAAVSLCVFLFGYAYFKFVESSFADSI